MVRVITEKLEAKSMPRILATEKWRKDRIANLSKWLSVLITDPSFKSKYFPRSTHYLSEFQLENVIHALLNKEIRKRYAFSNSTTCDYARIVYLQNEELINKLYIALTNESRTREQNKENN